MIFKTLNDNDITFLKSVIKFIPLQFFSQSAIEKDYS